MGSVAVFFEKYPWVLAVLLLVFGPLFTFFGRKTIRIVVGFTGGLVAAMIVLVFCASVGLLDYIDPTTDGGNAGEVALAMILSIGVGVGIGILLGKFVEIGILIMAFIGGYLLGTLFYNFLLVSLNSAFLLGFCAFGGAFGSVNLTNKYKDHIIIVMTSLIGSYFTVRGVSLFVGGFPDEVEIFNQVANKDYKVTNEFLYYLGGIMTLFALGTYF
jgi:hypothetical protein